MRRLTSRANRIFCTTKHYLLCLIMYVIFSFRFLMSLAAIQKTEQFALIYFKYFIEVIQTSNPTHFKTRMMLVAPDVSSMTPLVTTTGSPAFAIPIFTPMSIA